jgi:large subunit ribosomal protein L25
MSIKTTLTFKGEERAAFGTGPSRELRRNGLIPAIIYSNDGFQKQVSVPAKEVGVEYNRGGFFKKLFTIEVGAEKFHVIPREIQIHPLKETPIHADFYRVKEGEKVKVALPVEFINRQKSPGLKRGGVLNIVRRNVMVFAPADNIPEKLIADVGDLKIGDNVKWSKLNAPAGVEPVIKDRDFTIASIAGRQKEDEAAAAAAPAAAPAAAAKPAAKK